MMPEGKISKMKEFRQLDQTINELMQGRRISLEGIMSDIENGLIQRAIERWHGNVDIAGKCIGRSKRHILRKNPPPQNDALD